PHLGQVLSASASLCSTSMTGSFCCALGPCPGGFFFFSSSLLLSSPSASPPAGASSARFSELFPKICFVSFASCCSKASSRSCPATALPVAAASSARVLVSSLISSASFLVRRRLWLSRRTTALRRISGSFSSASRDTHATMNTRDRHVKVGGDESHMITYDHIWHRATCGER